MGLHLAFWDAATSTSPGQLTTSSATLNLVFGGSPDSPGDYCVAIFDVGNVQGTPTLTLTLTHY